MEILIYVGVIVLVGLVVYAGIILKNKFKVQKDDLLIMNTILNIANHLTNKFEFKYKDGIVTIISYTLEAIGLIEQFEDVKDVLHKKELIKEKAVQICEKNGFDLSDGTVEIVDEIVEYLIK